MKTLAAMTLAACSIATHAQETTRVLGRLALDSSHATVSVVEINALRFATVTVRDRHGIQSATLTLGPKGLAELAALVSGAQAELARGGTGPQPPRFVPNITPTTLRDMQ